MKFGINLINQKGQSLIEYLIIVALVAIGGIGIMRTVGQSINVSFSKVAKALGADVEGSIESARVTQSNFQKKNLKNFMNGAGSARPNSSSSDSADE